MKILAIDTATETCSAALLIDDAVTERYEVAPRRHAELILPMMESLLEEAGIGLTALDAVAFGQGPGAFTGVRIATGVIQGVAFGADLPVIGVSDLAAIAAGAARELGERRLVAAIDARMEEVYWGTYLETRGTMELIGTETIGRPEAVPLPEGEGWFGVGTCWSVYHRVLAERFGDRLSGWEDGRLPHAADIARLAAVKWQRGEAVPAESALPTYLRDRVAKKPTA